MNPDQLIELLHATQHALESIPASGIEPFRETLTRLADTARDLLTRTRKRYPSEDKERQRKRQAECRARKTLLNPSLCHAQATEAVLTTNTPIKENPDDTRRTAGDREQLPRQSGVGVGESRDRPHGLHTGHGEGLRILERVGLPETLFGEEETFGSPEPVRIDTASFKWPWLREVPVREREFAMAFQEMYQSYPHKVSPKNAWAQFKKLQKEWNPELMTTIQTAIARLTKESAGKEKQFIPHPATWLNQRRWESDETDGAKAVPVDRSAHFYSPEAVRRHDEQQRQEFEERKRKLMEETTPEELAAARAKIECLLGAGRGASVFQGLGAAA